MYLGVDLSLTATGICRCSDGRLECFTINPGARTGWERLGYIRDAVLSFGAVSIAIEGLSFGSNMPSAQERAGLWHMIGFEWWQRRAPMPPVIVVPPTTLKKFVCGNGKAEKSMMMLAVYKRWGISVANDNEGDAVGLCQIARMFGGDLEPETAAQIEVIEMLRTPKVKKPKKVKR